MQLFKDLLVQLGPDHPLVRSALWFHSRRCGYQFAYLNHRIHLQSGARELILNKKQYVQVPIMLECFDLFFRTVVGEVINGVTVLDFSEPRLHRYAATQVELYFPSIPEDDVMDAYTNGYTPQAGDVVWDVGAHAGATSYFLAKMVGPDGKVYAFEPDENNYGYLLKNIERHSLHNVIPIKKALSGVTGTAKFNMDGTMSAGLSEYLVYSDERLFRTVDTISLPDSCSDFKDTPAYIKMDIEGAEVATIESAQDFLRSESIHFAIESYHRINGELTYKPLEHLFEKIGYDVHSSDKFGQMFTWAAPELLSQEPSSSDLDRDIKRSLG